MSEASDTAVIRQHRGKLALVLLLMAVLTVVVGFAAWISSYLRELVWAYLGMSLFLPVAAACFVISGLSLWALLQPATLTLDESGVVYRSLWREQRIGWDAAEEFFVLSPEKRLRSPACRAGGRVVSFGRCWERMPENIVAVLQAAKEKFGAAV
jgi:hypothetical protein